MEFFSSNSSYSSIIDTAGSTEADGNLKRNFICNKKISFIANDSDTYSLEVNFDSPVGGNGTILLYPGEAISDLEFTCKELYAKGINGSVAFRALGV